MSQSSLTFIPYDDPEKMVFFCKQISLQTDFYNVVQVAQPIIEKGYDGSDINKIKGLIFLIGGGGEISSSLSFIIAGNQPTVIKILRNCMMTCKVIDFNQKLVFNRTLKLLKTTNHPQQTF